MVSATAKPIAAERDACHRAARKEGVVATTAAARLAAKASTPSFFGDLRRSRIAAIGLARADLPKIQAGT